MNHQPSCLVRIAAALGALTVYIGASAAIPDPALTAAVADPARGANFVARDKARHPRGGADVFRDYTEDDGG
jgi:predicted methyltransferase